MSNYESKKGGGGWVSFGQNWSVLLSDGRLRSARRKPALSEDDCRSERRWSNSRQACHLWPQKEGHSLAGVRRFCNRRPGPICPARRIQWIGSGQKRWPVRNWSGQERQWSGRNWGRVPGGGEGVRQQS